MGSLYLYIHENGSMRSVYIVQFSRFFPDELCVVRRNLGNDMESVPLCRCRQHNRPLVYALLVLIIKYPALYLSHLIAFPHIAFAQSIFAIIPAVSLYHHIRYNVSYVSLEGIAIIVI